MHNTTLLTAIPMKENEVFQDINNLIQESWKKIAPFWPLHNLIAVNPLQGLEELPIENALLEGATFFEQKILPEPMQAINRETIKWLQAFFDEGQATIEMPLRTHGLYTAWRELANFDEQIHKGEHRKKLWLSRLSSSPQKAIRECLLQLNIPTEDQSLFLTLMLTTLPGWASHIQYRTQWSDLEIPHSYPVSKADYLAMRLIITCLLWENAAELITWHKKAAKLQTKNKLSIRMSR